MDLEVKQTEGRTGRGSRQVPPGATGDRTPWTLGASEVEISYWGLDAMEPATLRAETLSALFTPHRTAKRGAPPSPRRGQEDVSELEEKDSGWPLEEASS